MKPHLLVVVGFSLLVSDVVLGDTIKPISIGDFSGNETLINFSSLDFLDFERFRDQGLRAEWVADRGRIQVGNLGSFFSNIPGASRGDALASTAAALTSGQLFFELDEPAHRFGLLISSGSQTGWRLTGYDELGQNLGSIENAMQNPSSAMFLGAEFSIPVTRLEIFEHQRNGQNDTFDDIRFESIFHPYDFDGNNVCDATDIDMILKHLGSNNAAFDIDGSGTVEHADRDKWLFDAGKKEIGSAFNNGDADLDGDVDSFDLNRVGLNWRRIQTNTHWFNADFDGSGVVDAKDLNTVGLSWRFGAAAPGPSSASPEPHAASLIVAGLIGMLSQRRPRIPRPVPDCSL